MDELKEVAAFDAWCVLSNPFHHTTDDGISNRRDWEVWQARAKIEADRQLRQGDAGAHVVGYINSTSAGLAFTENEGMARAWGRIGGSGDGNPVVRLSDAQAAIAAKDAEIERLKKVIKQMLDALAKFNYEESVGGWAGYENGHGQEVGAALDAAIAAMTQEIKP